MAMQHYRLFILNVPSEESGQSVALFLSLCPKNESKPLVVVTLIPSPIGSMAVSVPALMMTRMTMMITSTLF